MYKFSLGILLIIAFSNCGVSGTTKPTCESDAGLECNCDDEDTYSLAPETQQTVTCSTGTHLEGNECIANEVQGLDQDGDGFPYPEDCDDRRIDVNPDAEEICDARDNDCDGEVDGEYVCLYECEDKVEYLHNEMYVEDKVNINLIYSQNQGSSIYVSGCNTDLLTDPLFMYPGDKYEMTFYVYGLLEGDIIEKLVIRQAAGEKPIPTFYSDFYPTVEASLEFPILTPEIINKTDFEIAKDARLVHFASQKQDGSFVFENIEAPFFESPNGTYSDPVQRIIFSLKLYDGYSGYLQLSFDSLEDFIVTGKETITERPFPQQGEYVMVLCPDQDNDGEDDEKCGGTDPDDHTPFPETL